MCEGVCTNRGTRTGSPEETLHVGYTGVKIINVLLLAVLYNVLYVYFDKDLLSWKGELYSSIGNRFFSKFRRDCP